MRLSFIVLLAAISSLVATGNALPEDHSTVSKVTVTNPDQSVTGGQTSEKRFLRSAGNGSKMLKSDSFKRTKFGEWLRDNLSSYTVFIDKLGGKQKYRGLYNEYAKLHKASGQYP
ncbi:hypothetical protein V7S43_012191 [Phytophthora oleae]|uniref:RxLR effector protein n=1 Tax=Phytophthora oleae TaxID=2107226 RepID=A0ABD3F7T4_9STRA